MDLWFRKMLREARYILVLTMGMSLVYRIVKKLMEDIPNKVRDILGIIVDVNLQTQDGKDTIEICVSPSSYPVNYKGEYHYRSGSTKQLLRGAALTGFALSQTGI